MTERLWCTACGTVTRDMLCDCNRWGKSHEMYREPNFVNYADTMQEAAHEQAQRIEAMLKALRNVQKIISEGAMTGFNYKDGDWAERLFDSQQITSAAIKQATTEIR